MVCPKLPPSPCSSFEPIRETRYRPFGEPDPTVSTQTPHCSIFSWLQHHVPVVWQPAVGEEVNWELVQ